MSKGVFNLEGNNQFFDYETIPLLALAALYGELRNIPDIWRRLLADLLQIPGYSTIRIAQVTQLAPRSVSRLIHGRSQNPGFFAGFIIMLLHMCFYKQHYLLLLKSR